MLMPCACPSRAESLKHHCGPPLEPLVQGQQRQRHMRRMPPYLYIGGNPGRSTPQGLRGVLASPDSCIYFNKLLAGRPAATRTPPGAAQPGHIPLGTHITRPPHTPQYHPSATPVAVRWTGGGVRRVAGRTGSSSPTVTQPSAHRCLHRQRRRDRPASIDAIALVTGQDHLPAGTDALRAQQTLVRALPSR